MARVRTGGTGERERRRAPRKSERASVLAELRRATADRDAILAALDHLAQGVVLIGADGRVRYFNAEAARVFAERDGLWQSRGALCCSIAKERRGLKRALVEALAAGAEGASCAGDPLAVSRPSGRAPYEVLIVPLPGPRLEADSRSCGAVLFIEDSERKTADVAASMREVYGLTATEAQIAAALCRGESLPEIARALHVSHNTARSHLARILSKTGARRQTDLVRMLLTSGACRGRTISSER